MCSCVFSFFFFQAEDGIRDYKVTGVQTCALPISGQTNSIGYLSWSALVLAFSILPWCLFMGATFPLMMAYIRERDCKNAESFSFLYLANVLGAMSGTLIDRKSTR